MSLSADQLSTTDAPTISADEEQLRQSQKMEAVGRLAGGIAHDFNNMLTAIMGFDELLLEQLAEGTEEREAAEEIQQAAQRAAALTAQLLAFSRPRSGQPEPIDLNELLVAMGPMLSGILGADIDVRIEPDADRPYILADRSQIEQTILSCALNARDAMAEGGRVTIRSDDVSSVAARASGGVIADARHVLVSVTDTGTGMDENVRDRAFDPFFTTKPSGGTTGLGLAMAYSAIQLAGGRIRLESTPGRGSTVRIFLPIVDAPQPMLTVRTPTVGAASGLPATILVAEDEPLVRTFVEQVLRGAGHSVIPAADGTAALDIAARHDGPIDLLLTDIVMPGPSGIETARRMRTDRPGTRVLFMSGWAADALQREGLDEAAVALLPKPFSVDDLIGRVSAALMEPLPDA